MCQADFEVYPSPLPPLFAPAMQAIWTAILFVGDPVKKNRQSANKKFPAHNPSLPLRPQATNREACHFRIIPKSFTCKNLKLLLL